MIKPYPKTKRLPLHLMNIEGFQELPDKFYMSEAEMKQLLSPGLKFVREKMNGVSRPFQFGNLIVYYEDLRIRRVIPYTHLPDYNFVYMIKQVYPEGHERYLSVGDVNELARRYRWFTPPVLMYTTEVLDVKLLVDLVRQPSQFNPDHVREGIIIMNEDTGMEGKIINPEYDDNVHPDVYQDLKWEMNKLA